MCAFTPDDSLLLHSLAEGRVGITPPWGASIAEAAIVCFEDQNHAPGAMLIVSGHAEKSYSVLWEDGNDQIRRCWNDAQVTTEHGAYAVAVLIAESITGLTVTERSDKGTHIDFWLGVEDENMPPFVNQARLEVSGIRCGDRGAIARRMKEKLARLEGSSNPLSPYVIVVEFGTPTSEVQQK
jgi:hypothetical protein